MKITPSKCPECGEPVRGTIERLMGCAQVFEKEDGTFEYDGWTDIWWDEQKTVHAKDGRTRVTCANGHDWLAAVEDEDLQQPDEALTMTPCNECGRPIPDITGGGLANRHHAESCSLYSANDP
jgi:hypothetical protein